MKHHPLEWFKERKGTTVRKIRADVDRGDVTSYVPLDDYWVQRCFEQQSDEVSFIENFTASREKKNDPFTDEKPIIRIHRHPLSECESCSS